MSDNPTKDYNDYIRANLPEGMEYNTGVDRYQVNNHSFFKYKNANWYYEYIAKFSDSPPPDPLSAPEITGTPVIGGDAVVGQSLTATAASSTGNPTPVLSWQWQRNDGGWADIIGETSASHTVVIDDVGHEIRVVQTETNSEGVATATSGATGQAVYANRVLFLGDELQFNGMTAVHSGGDGVNTLTIDAGTGMSLTQTETLVTLDAN